MLRYIKRQTSRRRSSGSHSHEAEVDEVVSGDPVDGEASARVKRHSLLSTTSFCDDDFLEEVEEAATTALAADAISYNSSLNVGAEEDVFKYNSRLSMTLTAIVGEPNCLSYFVQYLERHNALSLIKFYLDTENFKRAALIQTPREHALPEQQQHQQHEQMPQQNANSPTTDSVVAKHKQQSQHSAEDDNDVPELRTLCDLSMRKPLTDDEKSRIYAETNKQLSKSTCLKASSELSLCSALSDREHALSAASIKDAIAIFKKYLIANAPQFVQLPIGILAHISLLLCDNTPHSEEELHEKSISANCFDEARQYVLNLLESEHVAGFLQSSYYVKYCLELIEGESAQLNIYDILYSELALFYFTEFLEQQEEREREREYLKFWITASNFRKTQLDDVAASNLEQTRADAMIIYERYFSLQSDCRLSMSDKVRVRVEQTICAPPEQLAHAFDLALLVSAKYLEQKYLANFLKSQIFGNYISELKAKQSGGFVSLNSQNEISLPVHKLSLRRAPKLSAQQRHRKALSMSDCTHISQHNTLLAAMDSKQHQCVKPTDMSIDSRQLTNPQLLWQRPAAATGALKFGRVNSLGRYERDFEDAVTLQTHSWSLSNSGNRIKNAMRKLVNLPEDNVQEEIAWQVAEMIVKDVTNVTLSGHQAHKP